MPRLPERPNLDHLRKQAKDLLAQYRRRDPTALARFRTSLPAATGRDDAAIAGLALRLHDAQSCLAREYGFASWADLRSFVEAQSAAPAGHPASVLAWLRLVYPGHIAGGVNRARPQVAARMLAAQPWLAEGDLHIACAIGDMARLRRAVSDDPAWVNRAGGPLNLPPLVAVTYSGLLSLPSFRDNLHACARVLLEAGADPNQSVGDRWPPASVAAPNESTPLSALLGAAGENRDPELTRLLLVAGANPNDGESLYHALESRECMRALLEAGARVTGSNALYRVLDLDDVEALRLLLAHGGDPSEPATSQPTSDWGSPLLWAIRRRRSRAHAEALLDAGADPAVASPNGISAHLWALLFGLPDVAELLRNRTGGGAAVSVEHQFVAACARGDEAAARSLQARRGDLPGALPEAQLRLLPELAALGAREGVQAMVKLGWPVAVRGGDWQASALNHAVFRGDAELTRFLLEHGASWREQHGFGDNACGTLSWASLNRPVEGGDWIGCAEALVAHGMPGATRHPQDGESVMIDGRQKWFSEDVTDFLLAANSRPLAPSDTSDVR